MRLHIESIKEHFESVNDAKMIQVLSEEKDLEEIHRDFIDPLDIPADKVLMMPGLDHQDNFHERTEWCLSMARKYGYIGLTRLHISAWNQTTGVSILQMSFTNLTE